jgi:hypothetical protein
VNTPTPTPPLRPDPTTPGEQPKPTALTAAVTSASAGTPLALMTVWLLDLAHVKLDPYTATAVGSIGAGIAGYLFRVLQALLHKWGIDPGP